MLVRAADSSSRPSYAAAANGGGAALGAGGAGVAWEEQAGFHYAAAARFASLRREAFESALEEVEASEGVNRERLASSDVLAANPADVALSTYLGQAPRMLRRGATIDEQKLAAGELARFLLAREACVHHSAVTIGQLSAAHQQYKKRSGAAASRVLYEIGASMAREYLLAG